MSTTTTDLDTAHTLGRNDRATFDVEYNAWLALDTTEGIPDYTDHFKDSDSALHVVLGGERLSAVTTSLDGFLEADDMDAHERLESEVDNLVVAYEEGFGPLPK